MFSQGLRVGHGLRVKDCSKIAYDIIHVAGFESRWWELDTKVLINELIKYSTFSLFGILFQSRFPRFHVFGQLL